MPNNALSGKPVTLSLIAIACIAAVGGIAFIVIGMQSPLTGDEKGVQNQTWIKAFDKIDEYHYQDDHPWLKGLVIVVPIDSNYRNLDGEPIGKNTNDPTINYVIFRETDHWGNVQKVSVLDSNTVSVLLHDYRSTDDKETIQKTLKIGARMVESCYVESDHIVIGNLILERIVDTNTPFAEFRDFATIESGTSCSFDDLMKVT